MTSPEGGVSPGNLFVRSRSIRGSIPGSHINRPKCRFRFHSGWTMTSPQILIPPTDTQDVSGLSILATIS